MKIGTKSVLFGAHAFFLHPWFVAAAWWRLYGFPFDPRLWVAFFVHDIGYLGKPNMDGLEGESHPEIGARIMGALFDRKPYASCDECLALTVDREWKYRLVSGGWPTCPSCMSKRTYWHDFSLYHSRFLAKQRGAQPSRLCVADKFALCLTPAWLYLPMVRATGEIREYMKLAEAMNDGAGGGKYSAMNISTGDQKAWYADVQGYLRRWVAEHKDGRDDSWTPAQKQATTDTGVWK